MGPTAPQPSDAPDLSALRSEIDALVRMTETVLDTLASQLRQDEQATRQFTEHLDEVDAQLERLGDRVETSSNDEERGSALAVLADQADAVRRLESGMEALFRELQRVQQVQQMQQLQMSGLAERALFAGGAGHTSRRHLRLDLSTDAGVLTAGAGSAVGLALRRGPTIIARRAGEGVALLLRLLRAPTGNGRS